MVSTRHHPREFPSPDRAAKELVKSPTTTANSRKWTYTPAAALTIWLLVSVPLVLWDASYVLLRPHSMPGGRFHSPVFTPYALYGTIDYIYGWPAFKARNGFTAAQTILNLVETAGYLWYLAIVYVYGTTVVSGRGSQQPSKGLLWLLKGNKVVAGRLNEYFSGYDNVGHNDLVTLVIYWIIPNGAWLVFPSYNIYILGGEILSSIELATPRQKAGRPKST
ncbi:unnamed protein product [Penicillium olsonii]|nr:unnamed protein product [Penicillium olsonii]CAG7929939.1 unnamed protein product [Penicillium olsonii]CAG8045068.1 unnamed protein product [Penicillium olsonii]